MSPTELLDLYCARIGYHGPRTPEEGTLREIHERHAQAIPFENLDVILGRGVSLDLEAMVRKLIVDRRGGYCFEHNGLLLAVLRALGFSAIPMLARVRWLVPSSVQTPQTHMALKVTLGSDEWLADAGFGASGLMTPLRLNTGAIQETGYEARRLVAHGRNLLQQIDIAGAWNDVYVLYPEEAFAIDFEVANWFTSTHPTSRFRQNLLVARSLGRRRISLLNREFTLREVGGGVTKRTLANPDDLVDLLASEFGLRMPVGTVLSCPGMKWD